MQNAKRHRGSLYRSTGGNNSWSMRSNRRNFLSTKGYPYSRDSADFLAYFVLFFICLFSLNSGDLPPETGAPVDDIFPTSKCKTFLPGCECDDLSGVIGIACQNVSDFETFTKVLENGSLFEEKTTYEITLSGIRILPRQFLKGLFVYRLLLDDPQTEGLEDGAFEDVLRLRVFHVWSSSITEIPDFQPVRGSLRTLNLHNSLLTSVEGDHLKNLTLLERLSFFNNSIRYVAADAFQGTENLVLFDMSNNYLQSLPPNLFDPWKKLKKVVVSNNHLLHVNQLFAVTHPQFIYLDHNNLTDLDSVLHPNMSQVEAIALSYNPFSKVTPNSFNGKVINTRLLYLDHCQIQRFDAMHFADLHSLYILDLSYNLIEEVGSQTISFGKNVEIDFTGNAIREFNAEFSYTVNCVYLNKNLMTTLGQTLQFLQMRQVSIADNRIQSLERGDFLGIHELIVLDLQGNLINSIEHETFRSLERYLMYLDLSRNKIHRLNGCVRLLSSLVSLNLTGNQIEAFEVSEFQGLNELTDLYLEGNRLQTLGQEVRELINLSKLVISNNKILSIKRDQLPMTLQYVYVDGNPLQCDCQMLPFLQYLNSTKNLKTDVPLCIPSNNTSLLPTAQCPDGCQCFCTNNTDNHYIFVDCSSIGLTQLTPPFAASTPDKIDFSSLVVFLPRNVEENIFFSESTPFVIRDEIGGMNFSHNSLQSMKAARLPEGTKHLFLDHNLLRDIPGSLLYSLRELETVTLSGNPWVCNCEISVFVNWIFTHSQFILDANETRCNLDEQVSFGLANRTVIWTVTDRLCVSDNGKYILTIVLSVIGCLMVASAVLIVWTRYSINIKLWLYAHGVTCVKEKDTDLDKDFDAFFSYSWCEDSPVVSQIISGIQEKEPNVKLALPTRFNDPSLEFREERRLRDCIENSKLAVIVLSRSFLEDKWCIHEFNAIHMHTLKDPSLSIIIIKLNGLPKDYELPEEFQTYLKKDTCLRWGDKYFWDKLLYFLPNSTSHLRQ